MRVFFYGLFMDEKLLAEKGVQAGDSAVGSVDGYALRIGQRATLTKDQGAQAFGKLMDLAANGLTEWYSEESVADYLPETLTISLADGSTVEATCYNLPEDKVEGANRDYAEALLKLATKLGLPNAYLLQIRQFIE